MRDEKIKNEPIEDETKNVWEDNIYRTLDNSIILHLPTTEFLIKKKDQDAQILFNFYCYCSKLQRNTKRVWASNEFCRKNLGWRKQKLLQVKKRLVEYGIINVVPYKEKSKKVNGMVFKKWFVEIIPLINSQNLSANLDPSVVPSSNTNKKSFRGSLSSLVTDGNQSSIINNNNKFYTKKDIHIFDPDDSEEDINPKEKIEDDQIQKIFQIYISKILPGSRLTKKAKIKIKSRLEEFSMEDILEGINNFSQDDWWMEHNAFRGITWFFYSEDRTEQFKNLIPRNKTEEKEILRKPKFR